MNFRNVTVDFSQYLSPDEVRRVAGRLAENESLESVTLNGCQVPVTDMWTDELQWEGKGYTDVHAILIARLLKENTIVTHLNLERNQIGDQGFAALMEMLKSNKKINHLNLAVNHVTGGACEAEILNAVGAFGDVLQSNATLEYLDLTDNWMTHEAKSKIRELWRSSSQKVRLRT